VSATPTVDAVELDALREFFRCWVAFHEVQMGQRQQQERAAQRMVDAAHHVRSLMPKDELNG
jgi:hypothetical protein